MSKVTLNVLIAAFILALLSACRPPEVEGTVLNIQKQLYDEAFVSAKNATEKYPENAEAWFYWGWLNAEQKKNYEEMNKAFDKVMALNPEQKVTFQSNSIPAKDAIKQYRTDKFADNYNAAVKLINNAQSAEDEAQKQKLLENARDKLQLSLRVNPERTEPYRPLALAHLSLGDTSQAEKALEAGLDKNPEDELMLISAGEVFAMSGKDDRASQLFLKALQIDPESGDVYQKLGMLEANQENWEKANEYYQKAIDLDPNNADLAYNIGVSFYNQENFEKAIPYFRQSLEAEPNNEMIHKILAGCYVRVEDKTDEAITFLESATQKFPEDATFWEYLAIVYGKKGMKQKADEAFQQSKQLQQQ